MSLHTQVTLMLIFAAVLFVFVVAGTWRLFNPPDPTPPDPEPDPEPEPRVAYDTQAPQIKHLGTPADQISRYTGAREYPIDGLTCARRRPRDGEFHGYVIPASAAVHLSDHTLVGHLPPAQHTDCLSLLAELPVAPSAQHAAMLPAAVQVYTDPADGCYHGAVYVIQPHSEYYVGKQRAGWILRRRGFAP